MPPAVFISLMACNSSATEQTATAVMNGAKVVLLKTSVVNLKTFCYWLNRGLLCAVYMGGMGATLYAAMYMHSYIMSLLFCGVQVGDL